MVLVAKSAVISKIITLMGDARTSKKLMKNSERIVIICEDIKHGFFINRSQFL